MSTWIRYFGGVLLPVALLAGTANAADKTVVAHVRAVSGTVTADNRTLRPGDVVYKGERVQTAKGSTANLAMVDEAAVHVRERTEFEVQEYKVAEEPGEKNVGVIQLLVGGLRTVTGAIGGDDNDDYQLKTPIATMGVRGTDFIAVVCNDADCILNDLDPGRYTPGLYAGTVTGRVYMADASGVHDIPANGVYRYVGRELPGETRIPDGFYSGKPSSFPAATSCWSGGNLSPCSN
ncbi:MAG: FecR domain-containing protein [Gammaproteobacteria bacterium]|jgi:hypothetical protein|nr:FecR domain-containing protein [Gammaproteobacteria bacterium]